MESGIRFGCSEDDPPDTRDTRQRPHQRRGVHVILRGVITAICPPDDAGDQIRHYIRVSADSQGIAAICSGKKVQVGWVECSLLWCVDRRWSVPATSPFFIESSPMKKFTNRVLLSLFAACSLFMGQPVVAESGDQEGAAPVNVTVLSTGAQPRKKIRYRFDPEKKEWMLVTMKMSMDMSVGGQKLGKQDLPPIVQTLEMTPTGLDNGILSFQFTLKDMAIQAAQGANPAVVAAMEQAAKGIVGMSGSGKIDDRGIAESGEIAIPANADKAIRQQIQGLHDTMSRISTPLPAEEIGVGAEWKVDVPIAMNGVNMKGEYVYKIVAIEGDIVKTTVKTTMDAKDQVVNDPNLPPGASIKIDSITGSGEGQVAFNLASLCPQSSITATIDQDATIQMEGQPGQQMNMKIVMKMSVAPTTAPKEAADSPADAQPANAG